MDELEKGALSEGEKKVQEYLMRIRGGESEDEVLKGLPEIFRTSVENRLAADNAPSSEVVHSEMSVGEENSRINGDRTEIGEIRESLGITNPDASTDLPDEIYLDIPESEVDSAPESTPDLPKEQIPINVELNPKLDTEGSIIINGNDVGNYWLKELGDEQIYIHNIQIGFDEDDAKAYRNKGVGKMVYEQLGEIALTEGKHLVSSHWKFTKTSISPQALRVWEKLEQEGKARITEVAEGKVYDREKGADEVKDIPVYEYIGDSEVDTIK